MLKRSRAKEVLTQTQLLGVVETINSQSVTVLERDASGYVLRATGTVTVSDGGAGYAKGCLYIKTDVGAGTTGVYENVGTTSACNFDTIGSGGGGATAFIGLSDVPNNYTADANKIVKVNAGETGLEFVTISGDVALSATGVTTVTDLTMAGEAQGNILYFNGTNWVVLAPGTNGYVLKAQGAGANPTWIDPATLPMGTATKLSQSFDLEGGANDITVAVTSQTVGAGALTIPDFAGVADSFAFITLAQTLNNKSLVDSTTYFVDNGDNTKKMQFQVSGVTAGQTRVMTVPDYNGTLATLAGTETLTNKSLSDSTTTFVDEGDPTKAMKFQVSGITAGQTRTLTVPDFDGTLATLAGTETLTNKTLSGNVATGFVYSVGGNAITFQNAIHTVIGRDTTDTLTNKTFDCAGTGNSLTNVNIGNLAVMNASQIGVPFVIAYDLENQAAAVNIFNANAPYKFIIVKAWSVSTSADGGTWKLNNGAGGAGTDITNAVTVAANADDFDEPTDYTLSASEIAANGSLSVVPDGAGLLDCTILIMGVRIS